jgi:hypothetical protein
MVWAMYEHGIAFSVLGGLPECVLFCRLLSGHILKSFPLCWRRHVI